MLLLSFDDTLDSGVLTLLEQPIFKGRTEVRLKHSVASLVVELVHCFYDSDRVDDMLKVKDGLEYSHLYCLSGRMTDAMSATFMCVS